MCLFQTKLLIRPRDSSWYSNELRKMKRKLIRLYHKAKVKMNSYHWNQYKSYRNTYHENLSKAEDDYNKKLCDSLNTKQNDKKWWSTVKCLLGKGNNQSYPPIYDESKRCYVSSSKDKATVFNDFFLSHSNIDTTNAQLPYDDSSPEFNLDNITATEQEINDLLQCLDTNKAAGHDGISAKMLKAAGNAIVPSLTKLINLCLSTNSVV